MTDMLTDTGTHDEQNLYHQLIKLRVNKQHDELMPKAARFAPNDWQQCNALHHQLILTTEYTT
jgi:hypothetical protein